jgi:tRNA G18 (ribose-2'-O)-methylase SpoU
VIVPDLPAGTGDGISRDELLPRGRPNAADAALAARGLFALEGSFLVERGRDAGLEFEALYCVPAREGWARSLSSIEPTILPEVDIAQIAGYPFHRGALALARRPLESPAKDLAARLAGDPSRGTTILILPETVDPANLGSAFRSAAALGCAAVLLGPRGPDPLCRRALRASMGATLRLPWTRLTGPGCLAPLAQADYRIAACVLDPKAIDLRTFSRPNRLALVLGNEAFGLSASWEDACDLRLTLPMLGGADSLNVAAAAAVFLYALGRNDRFIT